VHDGNVLSAGLPFDLEAQVHVCTASYWCRYTIQRHLQGELSQHDPVESWHLSMRRFTAVQQQDSPVCILLARSAQVPAAAAAAVQSRAPEPRLEQRR
jgi:hypothetical protein